MRMHDLQQGHEVMRGHKALLPCMQVHEPFHCTAEPFVCDFASVLRGAFALCAASIPWRQNMQHVERQQHAAAVL